MRAARDLEGEIGAVPLDDVVRVAVLRIPGDDVAVQGPLDDERLGAGGAEFTGPDPVGARSRDDPDGEVGLVAATVRGEAGPEPFDIPAAASFGGGRGAGVDAGLMP